VVGSGGKQRRALQGRGPVPKAVERTGHPAARRAQSQGRARSAAVPIRPKPGALEVVAGRNPVLEALRAAVPAKVLYVAARAGGDARIRDALQAAADLRVPVLEVPRQDLDRITDGAVHQGVALLVPPYAYAHPDDLLEVAAAEGSPPLIVALDGVTDPRNLGAVIRSAAAFGGHGVVVPQRRSAGMTASAWKASAGAAARVRVAQVTNLTRALEELKAAGCFVVGLDADAGEPLPGLDLATGPLVLVAGSEGRGLSRLVRRCCDVTTSIPMTSGTESLNAGVAVGVALYEVARRRADLG